ncbi:GrpB family protein [Flexivirga meconopsidis]|uniref:GrpB family protein n=1 Tax=Flexivirga meconopsidis TaxID=2977121 RepID=UPI002240DC6A|nr:GrpB family protein [Flexivirga meconopsidis]
MPFPDEEFARRVIVSPYNVGWAAEGIDLADRLRGLMPDALAVDHIGSTAVPGLPAKDCLDMMVRVADIDAIEVDSLRREGFRLRPEPWNRDEQLDGRIWPKLVFAPPVGGRSMNVHIRQVDSATARYALLFRDFLRADDACRQTWGAFKERLAESVPTDLMAYGQVKATAQPLLMTAAEAWAARTDWRPTVAE